MRNINLSGLETKGKSIFLAYDHGMEHGPSDFEDRSADPAYILDIALNGGYNGIILQKGVAEKYYGSKYGKVPLIVKLNGKTNISKGEPVSEQICSVAEASAIGAKAVGYTVYIGSAYESRMFEEFGKIEEEAHKRGMPVILWAYPRGKAVKKVTPELVEYAARVGLELGADFVKVQYTGSVDSFKKVVKAAGKCRVLCLGGSKMSDSEFLGLARNAMKAGAAGMAVGRNVWQHKEPMNLSKKLMDIWG